MRLLRIIGILSVLVLLAPTAPAARNGNLVQTAARHKNLSIMVKAIKAAGLETKLTGSERYTVFLPTNSAFLALPNETRLKLLNPKNSEQLRAFLLYHIVRGRITTRDILRTNSAVMVRTLRGPEVTIQHTDETIKVNTTKIVKPDLEASNGMVHAINTVLIPKPQKPAK